LNESGAKKRILEVYLNTIKMGKGIYGIEAASCQYYYKAKDLTQMRQQPLCVFA